MLCLVFFELFLSLVNNQNAVRVQLAVLALELLGRHTSTTGTRWLTLALGGFTIKDVVVANAEVSIQVLDAAELTVQVAAVDRGVEWDFLFAISPSLFLQFTSVNT